MANGKQLSQKGAEEILDIIDSYIDVKEAVEKKKRLITIIPKKNRN